MVEPSPPPTIEAWENGLNDTKTVGLCIGAKLVHRCVARPHSASLIGELRFAENGVFSDTRRVDDKAHCYRFCVSLNVYRNKRCVSGGALQLYYLKLEEERS